MCALAASQIGDVFAMFCLIQRRWPWKHLDLLNYNLSNKKTNLCICCNHIIRDFCAINGHWVCHFIWWTLFRCSDKSAKTTQSLKILSIKGGKFAECLDEKNLKIWEVPCLFSFMFTLCIKPAFYSVNHLNTTRIGSFLVNWCAICCEDSQQIKPSFCVKNLGLGLFYVHVRTP